MAKLVISLGLATSLAIFAIAIFGTPVTSDTAGTQKASGTATSCTAGELTLDDGYGVSSGNVTHKCAQAE